MLHVNADQSLLARGARWFLVRSQPKRESQAEWHLRAQGFGTFLPQFQKTIRHARKLRTVKAPLFPGYLFTLLDLERDPWWCVRSTVGVARLFSTCEERPIPVPIGIVELLIGQSQGDVTRLDTKLSQGQSVRILSGPFADSWAHSRGSTTVNVFRFCSR